MGSKLDMVTNEDFIEIINNCSNWKCISESLGYSGGSNYKIRPHILKRCNDLGIKPQIDYSSPILKMTKEKLFSSRKNWQSARTAIRKLADAAFKNSDKPKECAVCGYDKHIEIAHIKGVSEFGSDALIAEINDINNLVGLCPNHHWEFDNNQLSEEEKKKIYN